MKVYNVQFETVENGRYEFINSLLNKSIFNDYLFEQTFFDISILIDRPVDFLYRRIWECVYIKRGCSTRTTMNDCIINLRLSLSEAIQYIYTVTPPRLQCLIKDSIKSIDDITQLLHQFLIDDNEGQSITYLSMFKKLTHLESFDTSWNNDTTCIDVIRQHGNQNGLAGVVVSSSISIPEIVNNETFDFDIQMMFHCKNNNQLSDLFKILYESTSNSIILNIKEDDNGIYVMMYSHIYHGEVCSKLSMFIKEMYREFYRWG